MNKYFAGAFLVGLVGSVGCASTTESAAYRKYQADRDADRETLLGSRLIKPTTERMVKAVGNEEYNQENQHLGIANTFPQSK